MKGNAERGSHPKPSLRQSIAPQHHKSYVHLWARSFLDVTAPHFHVCSGMRPGGCFLQSEAWPVRQMVMDHVCREVERAVNGGVTHG